MTSFLWSAGGFVVVLGVLIFLHEAGHFSMAKLLGIRVETFSLGFGPRLIGFRRGHTDYRVSAVPLGGYVQMLGEHPDEELEGSPEEFQSRSRWERFLVLVMGPSVNLGFAYLLYVLVFMMGVPQSTVFTGAPVVGSVAEGSSAAEAGLLPGDRILAVGGEPMETWQDLRLEIVLNPDTEKTFTVERDGREQQIPVRITSDNKRRQGEVGIAPPPPDIMVVAVTPGSPAERAGLEEGDIILEAGGERIRWGKDDSPLTPIVVAHVGRDLPLSVLRDGRQRTITVRPDPETETIGVTQGTPTRIVRYGLVGAMAEAGRTFGEESMLLFKTVRKLVTGGLSMRALSGPLEIASFSGTTARLGLVPFLRFMGMVSLQLGVLNLFPIPILDGGHITILAAEGLVRREFPPAVKEKFMMAGLVALLALMVVVLYFDIVKLLTS